MGEKRRKEQKADPSLMSMTGFGRAVVEDKRVSLEIEVRAVNHRYLDCSYKAPRVYARFESDVRALVGRKLNRGRVEIFITRNLLEMREQSIAFNRALFKRLSEIYREALELNEKAFAVPVAGAYGIEALTLEVLKQRDVIDYSMEDVDEGEEQRLLTRGIEAALDNLIEMRLAEGKHLRSEILERLAGLADRRKKIQQASQTSAGDLVDKLKARLAPLLGEFSVDEQRLATELALMADKVDITEELVRLESHLHQFEEILGAPPCGRKLDFLIQELTREFNTIGSKTQDSTVQSLVVEAKSEIEKIREQVQNVE